MIYKLTAIAAACCLASGVVLAGNAAAGDDPEACLEGPLAQFGRYIGDWKIEDEVLSKDGSAWSPGGGERWIFECIGGGVAVQDYWLPANGNFGTNLRTYNPDTAQWEIAWAATQQNGLMHLRAAMDADGNIVMDIISPPQDPPRRIIVFAPDAEGWDWVQQWSFDQGATWVDVYRIRATPWTGADEETPAS